MLGLPEMKVKKLLGLIILVVGNFCLSLGLVSALTFIFPSLDLNQLSGATTGWRAYVVMSGSMEPAVGLGSVVFTQKQTQYKIGEVITFASDANQKNFITHRIVDGIVSDANIEYTTKGDVNEEADNQKINHSQISGKVMLTLPYLGYLANFAKSPKGFIFLVIVPATIIIYEELKNLFSELKKFFKNIKKRLFKKNQVEFKQIPRQQNFPKLAVVIPIIGSILVIVTVTSSFFADKELSERNIMSAATFFASPFASPNLSTSQLSAPTPIPSPSPIQTNITESQGEIITGNINQIIDFPAEASPLLDEEISPQ